MITKNYVTNLANINLETGERLRNDYIETVTYSFERNHMKVEVKLEPLEDFYIGWYMGLQHTRDNYRKDVYFTYDNEKSSLIQQTSSRIDSGTKNNSRNMNRITFRDFNDNSVHIYIDKDYGIGYNYIGKNDPICYLRESYIKAYYHLVKNGNNLIVHKGQKVKYRGGYIFTKNNAENSTNVSVFWEDGKKKAYVDFRSIATENINYLEVEESINCSLGEGAITSTTNNVYAKVILN
ncbi:hypothetical protein NSA50_17595 [Clostridium sp. DSM 100503]|uniref:hypothetical protein n=1 Tax=Clostridium sp. DSM 100503 TaxID=2963282 RepID=UPI00214A1C9D|nr:hypothetical protein [Clostridium sp. DSM 100503]MCR1952821.1 hypothetical protein [Clostridium sp. DSM 100503]